MGAPGVSYGGRRAQIVDVSDDQPLPLRYCAFCKQMLPVGPIERGGQFTGAGGGRYHTQCRACRRERYTPHPRKPRPTKPKTARTRTVKQPGPNTRRAVIDVPDDAPLPLRTCTNCHMPLPVGPIERGGQFSRSGRGKYATQCRPCLRAKQQERVWKRRIARGRDPNRKIITPRTGMSSQQMPKTEHPCYWQECTKTCPAGRRFCSRTCLLMSLGLPLDFDATPALEHANTPLKTSEAVAWWKPLERRLLAAGR